MPVLARLSNSVFALGGTVLALGGIILCLVTAGVGSHIWALHHLHEGERLVARQEYTDAYPQFVKALKVWRRSPDTELLAGRTARRAKMYAEAEPHFQHCLSLAGTDKAKSASVALERLLAQVQKGELTENEIILWGRVKRNDPDSLLILEAMFQGYINKLRLGPAMHCLDLILERDPYNVDALLNHGHIAKGTVGPTVALKDYRLALELRPDRDDIRLHLARLLVHDNANEALKLFEEVASGKPDDPELQMDLVRAYQAAGKLDEADAMVDQILERDPDNALALSEKGALLAVTPGRAAEGEALLRRAVARDPFEVGYQWKLYLCLSRQKGREAEADAQLAIHDRVKAERDRLTQILNVEMSKSPENPDLSYEVGMIYYMRGFKAAARRWWENALKFDPGHQAANKALFELFKQEGDKEAAEKHRGVSGSK
jgi:tetratricopeptide (TPR) repeat protein